jgi:hypothetical protein
MVHRLGFTAKKTFIAASLLGLFAFGVAAQEDPPTRVARLNYINGNVSMEPAGVDDWAPAVVNRPFTTGDYIYTDDGARAELHMDVAVLRMGPQTSFGWLNLDDRTAQLKLTEGDLYVRIRRFSSDQVFEVDTPNGAVTLLQNGNYRFRVDPNGAWSYTVVRDGQAQVTGGGQAFLLNSGESANVSGTDQISYDVETAPEPDDFDQWAMQRDQHEQQLRSAQYVSDAVIGYEDLDDNGDWAQESDYGPVWYPHGVDAGWAPYHYGHWGWIDPWGWTWVDDAQWGFAPFHYGRWVYYRDRWGWCPGPRNEGRPYYAPALVAWFGGRGFSVGVSFGGGGGLGWVALGFGEVYTPPYVVSQSYFRDVNVYNTRVTNVTVINNVYNTVYVNHAVYNQTTFVNSRAPNAVMAMPQSAFASGQAVRQAARPVPAADFARIQSARVTSPPVAPTRQSLMPAAAAGRAAARPPAQVTQRQVVARVTPPAPPAPFAARQQALQRAAASGQPINHAEIRRAAPAPQAAPAVRVVSAAPKPTAVRPGAKVGNPVVAARPGTVPQPGHVAPAGQPGRPGAPAPEARPGAPTPPPAAHGAPPNRPAEQPAARTPQPPPNRPAEQPAARTPQPPPARPEERPAPQPAAHGAPPNRPAEQPAARTPQPPPNRPAEQPAARTPQPPPNRPAEQPAARTPQPPPARPEERTAPAPAAHGAPPNRPAEQPAARTAQPTPARPAPEARPTPEAAKPAPAPARPAPEARPTPAARPAPEARPAPAPARPAPEARPAPAPARPAPEARPAPPPKPAPEHGAPPPAREKAPPKDTKDTKEH